MTPYKLTKPQVDTLVQFCSSLEGVPAKKKPDPRVIRSLTRMGMITESSGFYSPTINGFEYVRNLKVQDLRLKINVPKNGKIRDKVQEVVNPMPHEKWILEVASMMDSDLIEFEKTDQKTLKIAAYYSYQARANTLTKYMVNSCRDCLTVLQIRKLFQSFEPRLPY